MNPFLNLDTPHLNVNKNIKTQLIFSQNACISCLQQNIAFVNLSTCKHGSFLELLFKFKVEYQNSVICKECHHFLKKIELFKQQVEESFAVLHGQIQNVKPKKKLFQDLKISNVQSNDVDVDLKNEYPVVEEHTNAQQEHCNELSMEVKIEHDSYSDFETDVPLSVLKKKEVKKKKAKRKEVATKSHKLFPLDDKYEGKIALIMLSREEMLEEREKNAKMHNYLKLPYKCESCITAFDHELTLKDHMEKRHGPKKGGYECNICKSVLTTEPSYKEHAKRHIRRYECQACGKRYMNVLSAVSHYNNQHGTIEIEFECSDCNFTTNSHRRYRYHRFKHNHKQKQQCSLCDSTFVNNYGLRVHMFTVHKKSERVYSCAECRKVYSGPSGLAAHMTSAHGGCGGRVGGGGGGAYCERCATHFKTPSSLTHHLRTHSAHVSDADKKFICDECGVKFLTKSSLQAHVDFEHLKSTKHKCEKCSKVFKSGNRLKRHINYVHKKIRPPRNKICDHCGRGFTTLAILRCHIRTHTGARPLKCIHCPATFAHSAALYTHNKLLHKGEKRTPQTRDN